MATDDYVAKEIFQPLRAGFIADQNGDVETTLMDMIPCIALVHDRAFENGRTLKPQASRRWKPTITHRIRRWRRGLWLYRNAPKRLAARCSMTALVFDFSNPASSSLPETNRPISSLLTVKPGQRFDDPLCSAFDQLPSLLVAWKPMPADSHEFWRPTNMA